MWVFASRYIEGRTRLNQICNETIKKEIEITSLSSRIKQQEKEKEKREDGEREKHNLW